MDALKTGELIAKSRKALNLTQSQLAEKLHVSDKAISRWETGRGFPDISIIEDLCDELHITSYELFKGQRSENQEQEDVFKEGLGFFQKTLQKNKILSFLAGTLLAGLVFLLLFFHLNAPIYFDDPSGIVKIEKLSDGKLLMVLSEKVDDYDMETTEYEGRKEVFVSSYQTKLGSFNKDRKEKAIILGYEGEIDRIWYYPSKDGDILLYGDPLDGGVVSLPRLIYNDWIVICGLLCIVSFVLYFVFRKRYYGKWIFKWVFLPLLSLLVSMILVLFGKFNEVYNASYYFTGIVLIALVIYGLLLILIDVRNRKAKG